VFCAIVIYLILLEKNMDKNFYQILNAKVKAHKTIIQAYEIIF